LANTSHLHRIGRTSGFGIHLRGFGVSQEKMDAWILNYYKHNRNLLQRKIGGPDFDARMAADAISRGEYKPERTHSLTGGAAYNREKQLYMKYLGLATKGHMVTERMKAYASALAAGKNRLELLCQYTASIKLWCPQTAYVGGTLQQNGYRHYRIRPSLMVLFAVNEAANVGVEFNTDDLVLSALAYYWEDSVGRVSETFIKDRISCYLAEKAQGNIDYRSRFESLMADLKRRAKKDRTVLNLLNEHYAFARKCRNAGNDAYCGIIFWRHLGWIATESHRPRHWSCTQQSYPGTPAVPEYNIINLTPKGKTILDAEINKVPIWHRDMLAIRNDDSIFNLIATVNRLAASGHSQEQTIDDRTIEDLIALGLKPIVQNNVITVGNRPIFELQYDMPDD
jgi:hypothetical protein